MASITIQIPEELLTKLQSISAAHNSDINTLINDGLAYVVRGIEARAQYEEMAARGRGREEEALALLRT